MNDLAEVELTLGQMIRTWRKANGLSQVQAAELLNTSVKSVRNWEQGVRMPPSSSRAWIFHVIREYTPTP